MGLGSSRFIREHDVASNDKIDPGKSSGSSNQEPSATTGVAVGAYAYHELLKPKNWQDFQRACVPLFRNHLKAPNAHEYGRGGQNQKRIDIIARRNQDPNHYVGVQCRRVVKPLKREKILSDCWSVWRCRPTRRGRLLSFRTHSRRRPATG